MRVVKVGSKQFQKLCDRNCGRNKRVTESVRKIVENVRLYGDDAIIKYTRKFDRVKLSPKDLKVSECETSGAYQDIKPDFVSTLKVVMDNITKFYKKTDKEILEDKRRQRCFARRKGNAHGERRSICAERYRTFGLECIHDCNTGKDGRGKEDSFSNSAQ